MELPSYSDCGVFMVIENKIHNNTDKTVEYWVLHYKCTQQVIVILS